MHYRYSETDVWGIPGGSTDAGETISDAIKREAKEELDIEVEVGNLLCVLETPSAGKVEHTLHCVFKGRVIAGTPGIRSEHTSALDVQWIEVRAVDKMVLYPPINDVIMRISSTEGAMYLGMRERRWF